MKYDKNLLVFDRTVDSKKRLRAAHAAAKKAVEEARYIPAAELARPGVKPPDFQAWRAAKKAARLQRERQNGVAPR